MSQGKTMQSQSDERVANNVMRHEYRVLSEDEKVMMRTLKDKGLDFVEYCDFVARGTGSPDKPHGSRELSLAKTKIEEAVMWAVKHLTR